MTIVKDVKSVWDSRVWDAYNDWADEILFTRWVDQPVVPPATRYRGCLDITTLPPRKLELSRVDQMMVHEAAHQSVSERLSAKLQEFGVGNDAVLHEWLSDLADEEVKRVFAEMLRDLRPAAAPLAVDHDYYLDLAEQQAAKLRHAELVDLAKREFRDRLRIRLAESVESPQIPVIDTPIEPNAPSDLTVN